MSRRVDFGRQRVTVERIVGNPFAPFSRTLSPLSSRQVAVDLDFADAETLGDGLSIAVGSCDGVEMRVVEVPKPGLADAERNERLTASGGTGFAPGHDAALGI